MANLDIVLVLSRRGGNFALFTTHQIPFHLVLSSKEELEPRPISEQTLLQQKLKGWLRLRLRLLQPRLELRKLQHPF